MSNAGAPVLSIDGRVARLRLNRPREHNRIEPEDLDAIAAHLRIVEKRPELRVLVFESTGKTFSAGFHLGAIAAGAPQRFEQVADALAACRVPTIAAIQGSVYGGAADLALACDFRIGVRGIQLMVPAVRLGIPYYASGIERFVTRLSLSAAKRILLAGEKLDARGLIEIGYLDEIVPRAGLAARVSEWTRVLAGQAPAAMESMKRLLNGAAVGPVDRKFAARAIRECLASEDHKQGLAAWVGKKK